jgi:diguanylate cyclase (GGDEF)-like protein
MAAGLALIGWLGFRLLRTVRTASAHLLLLATTDPLTGRPNHRTLVTLLDREVARGVRYERPFGLLFIDIDRFKALNDQYGHSAGDAALCAFAGHVAAQLRSVDVVGRWGGEEFLAILPESDGQVALTVAEHVRSSVAAHDFGAGCGGHMTCSIGVAGFPADGATRDGLVEAADRAMYAAKGKGRNQVLPASDVVVRAASAHRRRTDPREATGRR